MRHGAEDALRHWKREPHTTASAESRGSEKRKRWFTTTHRRSLPEIPEPNLLDSGPLDRARHGLEPNLLTGLEAPA